MRILDDFILIESNALKQAHFYWPLTAEDGPKDQSVSEFIKFEFRRRFVSFFEVIEAHFMKMLGGQRLRSTWMRKYNEKQELIAAMDGGNVAPAGSGCSIDQ